MPLWLKADVTNRRTKLNSCWVHDERFGMSVLLRPIERLILILGRRYGAHMTAAPVAVSVQQLNFKDCQLLSVCLCPGVFFYNPIAWNLNR